MQYFIQSVAYMLKYHHYYTHWCIFFFSTPRPIQRPPNTHFILNQGAEAYWALPGKQITALKQNFYPRKKKQKGLRAMQTTLETFSPVRCCRIHRVGYLQLQLNCNYTSSLQHTTLQLPFPHFISARTKHMLHLLSHLHYVQLILANLLTTGLLLFPLNNCIQRSRKQLFRAPTLPMLAVWYHTQKGVQDT